MANRRMFSNRIGNSAKFLQMPSETQLLYFHLVLRADDDGIVESYPVIKLLGLAPDNFKVLLAKGYVQQINEDQVVVIMDWLEHNNIRADRKIDSVYKHLLPEGIKIVEPKPRSDVEDNSKRVGGQSTDGIGKVRLGKDRKGKVTTTAEETSAEGDESFSKEIPELIKAFETINPACKKMYGIPTQRQACANLIENYTFSRVRSVVENTLPKTNALEYFPTITTPAQLWEKWSQLEASILKYQGKQKSLQDKQNNYVI